MYNRLINIRLLVSTVILSLAISVLSQDVLIEDDFIGPEGISIEVDASDFDFIFQQDLDETPIGPYTREQWGLDWNYPPWANGIYSGDRTIIDDFNKGGRLSRAMKWVFPEGSFGAHSSHGYQWQTPLGGKYEEIYLTYSIMFKPGFESVLGGKIPGLMASPKESGPPGWEEGFGGSLMFKQRCQPVFYIYHQDQPGQYGDTKGWGYNFDVTTDTWYDITYRVVMNTATATSIGGPDGLFNGILEGYVDGILVGQWTNIRLRNLANIGIDVVRIQGFFGGGSSDWATIRDEWMLIDNVSVWKYSDKYLTDNPSVKRGRQANPWKGEILTPMDVDFSGGIDPDPDPDLPDSEPPSVPTGLQAIDSTDKSIQFSWNASVDNVGVKSYKVFLNNLVHGATGETKYNVAPLDAGIQYSLAVSAIDAESNESAKSPAIQVYTRNDDSEAPTVPSGITITRVTGYSIEITWQPSQDNVGVARYSIYIDKEWAGDQPTNSYYASGLNPDTEYEFAVRAYDAAGNPSPLSASVSQRTGAPDNEAPSVPQDLIETEVTEKTISLEWNPSTDNVAVSEYLIYVNNEIRERSSSSSETIAQLEPGIEYEISVSAIDEAQNESVKSTAIDVKTKNEDITTSPVLPTITILTVQDKTINPSSVTEMSSLGFTELRNYGIEIKKSDNQAEDSFIMKGVNSSSVINQNRTIDGLQALYNFSEGEGNLVKDIFETGTPLNLKIKKEGLVTEWLSGQGLRIYGSTILEYEGSPDKLINSISQSNEITLEAWIKQEDIDQSGPARIITLSEGKATRAVTLGHEGNKAYFNYVSRLNTTATDENGMPELATNIDFISQSLHHLIYTRNSAGEEKFYVNGWKLASGTRVGDFSSWGGDYRFALANELSEDRPWNGILYLVAVYSKALNETEVKQNFDVGFGQIRFVTPLDTLTSNVSYTLTPFVSTDQGVVYGEPEDFLYQNVALTDSLLAFFPNPNNGNFELRIKNRDEDLKVAYLRIAGISGQVHYNAEIDLSEGMVENKFLIQLPPSMKSGFYSMMLIAGVRSETEKLILIR